MSVELPLRDPAGAKTTARLTEMIGPVYAGFDPGAVHLIGVLAGEGVGPEVVPVAMRLLDVLAAHSARRFEIRAGGLIGTQAKAQGGASLSPEVADFAAGIARDDGVLFCGPGGDRFVYELRQAFDLFCKFTPLQPLPELQMAGVLRERTVAGVDIIAVRENMGGLYQGRWSETVDAAGCRVAQHQFGYTDAMVNRILAVAFATAAARAKRLHLVLKPGGAPSISRLWRDCAEAMARDYDVTLFEQEVDNAVYQLIADPHQFDVIVSPNMFGDVLADCGALLLASRGLSYSGNFSSAGFAAYQTGHGAARDIAGQNVANPIAQIFALGMMLRESFAWAEADALLRAAVRRTLRAGLCTRDTAMPGHEILGTKAFGAAVEQSLVALLDGRRL